MGRILAVLFAAFAVLASFGMGNMTQGNSIAEALAVTFGVGRIVTGLALGIFTILVILGGIDKIARRSRNIWCPVWQYFIFSEQAW